MSTANSGWFGMAFGLSLSTSVWALDIQGEIKLSSGGKALRASEAVDAVVYFRPTIKAKWQAPTEEVLMVTERKRFIPSVLPIMVGTKVRFPNRDPILHNAFSTTPNNAFDTDLYGKGEGATHQFESSGLVRVYCNVHHSMMAHILVLDTPFFTKPDANGRFHLKALPTGAGELFVWHERSALLRKPLTLSVNQQLVLEMSLNKRKIPPHLNKFGKPYRRVGTGDY